MKRFLTLIIRFSILNFIFLMLAVGFLAKYNEGVIKPGIREYPSVTSGKPSQVQMSRSLATPTPKAINLFSELQNHNNRNDCWIAYSGHVYNITSFFGSHPGGDSIMLPYCGKDATAAFNGVPHPHSENAKSLLQQYLVQ